MKIFVSIVLALALLQPCHARNYYLSATGNDANTGTSPATAWRTIDKLNIAFGAMAFGDSVLFKRGDSFHGMALVMRSGISFGAYGTGAKPKRTGLVTVTGFTLVSPGLYRASLMAPNDLRFVTINDNPVEWGTTPNKGNGAASWLYAETYKNSTPRSISDRQLTNSPNRTGHRFVFKAQTWDLSFAKCITHVDTTLTYSVGSINVLGNSPTFRAASREGTGYKFCGNIIDCDSYGEWAYDSTGRYLYVYLGATNPASVTIKASTVDILFHLGNYNGTSIQDIEMEGANKAAVWNKNGSGNTSVKRCFFNGGGARGLAYSNIPYVTVEDNVATNIYGITFRLPTNPVSTASVQRNIITYNGTFETMMETADDQDGSAITCGMSNSIIQDNIIYGSGYHGLWWTGSNVLIQRNRVTWWSVWLNDCGAFYTFALAARGTYPIFTNRIVRNNIGDSASAMIYGFLNLQSAECKTFYNDAQVMNVLYEGNLSYNADIGFSNNNTTNVTLMRNTIVARRGINFYWYSFGVISNFKIQSNLISNINSNSLTYYHVIDSIGSGTVLAKIAGDIVTIDSNICNSGSVGYSTETYTTNFPRLTGYRRTNYNLAGWRVATGKSANDVLVPFIPLADTGRKVVINWGTNDTVNVALSYKYKDYYGATYNGTIRLAPYSWALLYKDAPIDNTPVPPAGKVYLNMYIKKP